jgi:hypothetical protein
MTRVFDPVLGRLIEVFFFDKPGLVVPMPQPAEQRSVIYLPYASINGALN